MPPSEPLSSLLTSSRLRTARGCQREHHLKYGLGIRPIADVAVLRFGTLCHKGFEAWWDAKKAGLPATQWLDAALTATLGEADPFDRARAQVLLTGYHLRWKDEPFEVLAVEQQFECALRNPKTGAASRTWRLAGKVDVVVRDLRDGLVKLVEHKTTSEDVSAGSDYWKRLRMDGQVTVYFEGGASLGYDIAACVYDVVRKPQQRPLEVNSRRNVPETADEFRARIAEAVAEDPTKYFARGEVVRLEDELAEHLFDIWQVGQQIREAELAERFPKNPDACVRFGRLCPFFAVCAGEATIEDERLFKRADNVHPELAESTPPQPESGERAANGESHGK